MSNPLTVVYIPAENEEDVYMEAQLIDSHQNTYSVRLEDGRELEVEQKQCLPAPVLGVDGEQDMIFLEHLNEGSLLHNLRKRFFNELIYTYTGSILMSVNPYRMLPIYTPAIRRAYSNKGLMECPPHVFAIADVCYRAMLSESVDQSILISGESGAGKTETCKLIMSYLSFISEQEAMEESQDCADIGIPPNEKVLATNPVLEAFGNAKTVRNDNSSRFGKMLDVQFDGTGLLIGASIRQYLLEQIRVIRQNEEERNFHCFYYICCGADKTERERFSVTKACDYYYTNQSGIYELPNINSKYEYIELKRAMNTAGITPPQIFNIMKLMAAILWLGNISFEEYDDNKCRVKDTSVLKWAALLLEVNPSILTKALITRENSIRGETYIVPLGLDKVLTRRDSLSKMLYQKNFEQIVTRLNENIDAMDESKHHCLLLDIFGFEVFDQNYFEQFCINFANERLQFEFNEHIFRLEQQVYKSENIDISAFRYNDNKPTIHLIEKKPQGILWLLDEQAKFPQSTDKSFYEKICNIHKKRKNVFIQPRFSKNEIIIKHYAGDVTYDTIGFLEKTKKSFGIQMKRMMKNSQQKDYAKLFVEDENEQKSGNRNSKRSVGIEFRNALSKLMNDLKQTDPHYVRCIKPNELKSYQHFNGISVLRQLKCSGVLETIRIRSGGYPNRRPFKEFIQRYLVLAPSCNRKGGPRNVIDNMCKLLNIQKTEYKLGITKIFLKDKIFHILEATRNAMFTKSATTIQKYCRAYNCRMEFWIIKASAELLQYRLAQYLKAADPSQEVMKIIKLLQNSVTTNNNSQEIVNNIMNLEKLGIRDKNVDIIADLGGVKCIIDVSKKFKGNSDIEMACTRALHRFCNNEENATKVARSGGVKQMVRNVKKQKENTNNNNANTEMKQETKESIELIDKLATVNRNVNIVIKERTVDALTHALNTNDVASSHIAAKALGTITKHRAAALRIGRDEKAIETVLNSIRNKPTFGRMVTYSLNCVANLASTNKHNWESIVELGGIDVAMLALENHIGNPSVIKEVGRLFCELCKNETYAQMIVDSGALQLALKYMKKNPDGCGVSAAKLIDDITKAAPEQCKQILLDKNIDYSLDDEIETVDDSKQDLGLNKGENGLGIVCETLNKMHKRPDISAGLARTINNLCDISPEIIEGLAHCSAPQYILTALQTHPQLSNVILHESKEKYVFPIDCVESLIKFAKFDITFLDAIKQDGAVTAIALTMDKNPELESLIKLGTDALILFAEQDDLRHAMDIIARSRMESDTFEPKLIEESISIVGSLVLMESNAAYVVSEGGIAIFLSIIAGKIKTAGLGNMDDAMVLASSIRALGRLIGTEDTIAMWQEEGGLHTFEDIVTNVYNSELVMNSICEAMKNMLTTRQGIKMIKEDSQLLPLLISKVFKTKSTYTTCIPKIYSILSNENNNFLDDSKLVNLLIEENGLIEGIKNHLEKNKKDSQQVILSMNFITTIVSKQPKLITKNIVDSCARTICNTMKLHKKDPNVLHSIYDTLYALIHNDPNVILAFKQYGFEQILAEILDQKDLDEKIYNETNTFLSTLISDDKIITALDSANAIAQKLISNGNDIGLIEDLDKRLIFIANVCGAENKYKTVIDSGGLVLLPTCFQALNEAKDCLAREHAIESCAFAAYKLGEFGNPRDIVEDGCYGQMADLYLNNVAYEGLADYLAKLTTFALKKPELINELHEQHSIEANIQMINNFPLKDDLSALAACNIGKLATDYEKLQHIVQSGGVTAICEALSYMLISEITNESINILQSLQNMVKLCIMSDSDNDDDEKNDNIANIVASNIDDNGINLLIESIKMREEPKLVEQGLITLNLLCDSDSTFCERFIAQDGLNEIIKDLQTFKGESNLICESAMKILSNCCANINAPNEELADLNIISQIKTNINCNKNNELILSSGVSALASLAKFKDISFLANEINNKETMSVIAGAVSARPRDIILTKAMATYITNIIDIENNNGIPDPKIIAQLKQFGLINILESAATVHSNNALILPIIEGALDVINPKAENVLTNIVTNINNESIVIQSLNDILAKLLSIDDKPFDAILLTNVLVKIWTKYEKNSEEVAKLMIDIVYELSESPEYYGQLMQCGLVEILMNSTITDISNISTEDEELLADLELGTMNILNNLAMINDGKQYLDQIGCQEIIVKNALNNIVDGSNENDFDDTDEQILLRGLRTIALLNETNDFSELINNGLVRTLQNIAIASDNQLLAKEVFSMLEGITINCKQIEDNDFVEPESINTFIMEIMNEKFGNNSTVQQYCNNILTNLEPLVSNVMIHQQPPPPPNMDIGNIGQMGQMGQMGGAPMHMIGQNQVQLPPVPPPPNIDNNIDNMDMDMKMSGGPMIGQNQIQLEPMSGGLVDVQLEFKQALDRRLDEEQKEKALLAFIDIDITENDIAMLMENHAVDKLISTLSASKKIKHQQKLMNALHKVTQKGDENFEHFIGAGGVGVLVEIMNENLNYLDAECDILIDSLHFIGDISANNHLKTVLGMHNIIQLMIKCIRQNGENIKILDSCFYVLANLAYDHFANMTQIIELGGVDDIFNTIKNNISADENEQNTNTKAIILLMRSAMDLLSNLMHNSDNNRKLICVGCKYILSILQYYSRADSKLTISCFRSLGNLAYVPDNINKLVREGIIETIVNSMTSNLKNDECLQMGAAVLSNIAADEMVSEKMIDSGVLNILLHISTAFPDLIELQKSCLGCMGNIANNAQNCYTMIDSGCGKRILEILERLYFDDNIIKLSLSLIKILTISQEISTQFTRDSLCEIIVRILSENRQKFDIIRLCSQTLCKCIITVESSEIAGTQNVVKILCDIGKTENNCFNASLMIDIMKVFQNMCQIEMNSQNIARYSSIPILRGMEAMKSNTIYINVSSTLIGNLAIYSSASKHIVKRGGCAVLIECIKFNVKHQGVLAKLLRCISNLVLTETKSYQIFINLQTIEIIQQIKLMYPNNKQIIKCCDSFLKAMKLKSHKLQQTHLKESKALKDKVNVTYIKYLTSGVMMKKYCSSAKPRKRILKLTDDLEHILLIDPNNKKAPKQLYVRHITELRTGACTFTLRRSGLGWKKAKDERCFAIFTQDQHGKVNDLNLECKTEEIFQKWTQALQEVIQCAHEKSQIKYT